MSQKKSRPIIPVWLSVLLSLVFVATGIIVSVLIFLTAEVAVEAARQPLNPLEEAAVDAAGTVLPPLVQEGAVPIATLEPGQPTPTLLPSPQGYDGDRLNILMMGIDRRPGEPFISRTDTMMLLSVDPESQTASLLSIPRDLYVVIPGRGRDRINAAFVYGADGNNPAGGAAMAMQTVEYNLGVPVDHYLMVDFNAFVQAIDSIGGITVEVPYDIYDPQYPDMDYGYDPLYIEAGTHEFNGATALKYARTRHQDSDFYRARRQQQVLMAIRSKVLGLEMLTQGPEKMVLQFGQLYRQLEDGIRTDMSLQQLIQLGLLAREIPSENIKSAVLDHNYVDGYVTEHGAQVLILQNQQATVLINELFYGQ